MKSTSTRLYNPEAYSFSMYHGLFFILLLVLLLGCSDETSSSSSDEDWHDIKDSEFLLMEGFEKWVELGSNDRFANVNEKPMMVVKLDYEYLIGKHEVTCKEFREFITEEFTKNCRGDNYPITDITFYDAILFANAKTKSEIGKYIDRKDTAYTYTAAEFDTKGHCIYLENFRFKPDVIAYRLPTEAEWMFVASKFWNAEHSWNINNSSSELHEVCTADSKQKVCDMAGNAMEWVNDWFIRFKADTLVNFIGAEEANEIGQRILKGGNFNSNPSAMHSFCRGDIYTVTSSTMADYVGFRLTFGPIQSPTWLNKKGNPIYEIPEDSLIVDPTDFMDPDSAGIYYKSGGSENAIMLRYKMEILWKYHKDSKLVILGSSRSMYGINPLLMDSNLVAINLSHIPNSLFASDFLFKNYVLKHLKQLKFVVLSLDIDMWWRDETDSYDNFFLSEYKIYPGYIHDENHNFWENGYPEGLLEQTHKAPGFAYFEDEFMPTRGFIAMSGETWEENPTVDYDSTWIDKKPELYQANLNKLKEMIELAQKNNLQVIGVIFPQSPNYTRTGAYARYGFRRSQADSLLQEIADLSKIYHNFTLMDEYKAGYHDYPDSLAANSDHLNEKGSRQLTRRLDSLVKELR